MCHCRVNCWCRWTRLVGCWSDCRLWMFIIWFCAMFLVVLLVIVLRFFVFWWCFLFSFFCFSSESFSSMFNKSSSSSWESAMILFVFCDFTAFFFSYIVGYGHLFFVLFLRYFWISSCFCFLFLIQMIVCCKLVYFEGHYLVLCLVSLDYHHVLNLCPLDFCFKVWVLVLLVIDGIC